MYYFDILHYLTLLYKLVVLTYISNTLILLRSLFVAISLLFLTLIKHEQCVELYDK